MVMATDMPLLAEPGFVFSTKDFKDCFRPFSWQHFYTYVEINNHTHGEFLFLGSDIIRKFRPRQCAIRITVPRDKIFLFELLDLALPCRMAKLQIFNSTRVSFHAKAADYCGRYRKDNHDNRVIVPFHTCALLLSMHRFVSTNVLHLRFSSISQLDGHQLQHVKNSKHKGCCIFFFFFLFVCLFVCLFVLEVDLLICINTCYLT